MKKIFLLFSFMLLFNSQTFCAQQQQQEKPKQAGLIDRNQRVNMLAICVIALAIINTKMGRAMVSDSTIVPFNYTMLSGIATLLVDGVADVTGCEKVNNIQPLIVLVTVINFLRLVWSY